MNQDEMRAAAELCESRNGHPREDDWELAEAALNLARAHLAEHPADDSKPATPEWWERVQPEGEKIIQILEIGCDSLLSFSGKCVCDNPTRRQVRCLAEACGVKLREAKQ